MVTLRDIAREAGCSTATVSRALNGGSHVDPETRTKVQRAASALGYRTNTLARSLRRKKTHPIGLVIPTLEKFNYTAAVRLLHDALSAEGYHLILCCHRDSPDLEATALRSLVERQVDAIVHVPHDPLGARGILGDALQMPVVELYRRSSSSTVDAVVADDQRGGHDLARHLIDKGHRRIALIIGDERMSTTAGRVSGFKRAIAEAGLANEECPVRSGLTGTEFGRETLCHLLDRPTPPTAVIAGSTQISLGVIQALHHAKARVPDDISLVAYSNADWCAAREPPHHDLRDPPTGDGPDGRATAPQPASAGGRPRPAAAHRELLGTPRRARFHGSAEQTASAARGGVDALSIPASSLSRAPAAVDCGALGIVDARGNQGYQSSIRGGLKGQS